MLSKILPLYQKSFIIVARNMLENLEQFILISTRMLYLLHTPIQMGSKVLKWYSEKKVFGLKTILMLLWVSLMPMC